MSLPDCSKLGENFWETDCGNPTASLLFFGTFYVAIAYIVLNLLVGKFYVTTVNVELNLLVSRPVFYVTIAYILYSIY